MNVSGRMANCGYGGTDMAIADLILNAKIFRAQLAADLGAVDVPEAVLYQVLGLNIYQGQLMFDSVTGQIVEVQHGGVETVSTE